MRSTRRIVYGLGLISATDASGVQTYHLYDGLGSTTDLTDATGNSVDAYTYDVFGALRSQSGSSANPWLFTGEQLDPDSDMYYLRARYYDPAIGRFLTQDPLPAGNLYAYVHNNPVRYVDPSGLCIPGINCPPGLGGGTQPPSLARSKEGGGFDTNEGGLADEGGIPDPRLFLSSSHPSCHYTPGVSDYTINSIEDMMADAYQIIFGIDTCIGAADLIIVGGATFAAGVAARNPQAAYTGAGMVTGGVGIAHYGRCYGLGPPDFDR